MALIKTNPVFFSGEEREREDFLKSHGLMPKKRKAVRTNEVKAQKELKRAKKKELKEKSRRKTGPRIKKTNDLVEFERIMNIVCLKCNVTIEDVRSKRKTSDLTLPRNIISHFTEPFCTNVFIGIKLGNKHHTSVSHMLLSIQGDILTNRMIEKRVREIEKLIKAKPPSPESISDQIADNYDTYQILQNQL